MTGDHTKHMQEVLSKFGIHDILRISSIRGGSQGDKWRIQCRPRITYLLKRLDAPKPKYLDFALQFQQAAEKAGLAPLPIPTTKGLMSVHQAGNDYVVEAYLRGSSKRITTARAIVCGSSLGRLHIATNSLSHSLPLSGAWEFLAGMAYAHVRAIMKKCENWEDRAPGVLQNWTASIECMSAFLADVSLPRGAHGDVNPTNILWVGRHLHFCDFANSSPLPQFVDVAMAVIGLGILEWSFTDNSEVLPASVTSRLPVIDAFLTSYNDVRRLLPQEKAMLPDALRVLWGFWSAWFPAKTPEDRERLQRLFCELDAFAATTLRDMITQL